MSEFWIRKHHLEKFTLTAESFKDRSPEELAEEWISGLERSRYWNARYQLTTNPQAREAMRNGFAQHMRDIREGKTPRLAEGEHASLDPICTLCVNAWCGDSMIHRT